MIPPPPVVVERDLEAPPGAVFAALTEPARLDRWFFTVHEVWPGPGGRYRIEWHSAGDAARNHSRYGAYLDFEPPHRLAFEWQGPQLECIPATRVSITLDELPGSRTHFLLVHDRWPEGWDELRGNHLEGWNFYADSLARYLAGAEDVRGKRFGQVVRS
ncbi:MAG: SRPBCC domain-containing protein [Candidatus Eisenbacteria bacterium]|nr:SRPBCC domain-containing protein [Candidatus Eisenbacteria bacterium]